MEIDTPRLIAGTIASSPRSALDGMSWSLTMFAALFEGLDWQLVRPEHARRG
jgi:hypothetical protein